jgi:S-formylglutathione hydrolase
MGLEILADQRLFGGRQLTCRHASVETGGLMRFALYLPPAAADGPVPALWFLSGLTCTEENVTVKAGAQRFAAREGLAFIAPDTSPRGVDVPDDPDGAWDFGLGAGFYVDATQAPWSRHYRMWSYLERELPAVLAGAFPLDLSRQGVTGHSMGGHGALTMGLRHPGRFRSVSAFAPIASPMNCPWGQKALTGYLGHDRAAWRAHDACALIEDGARLDALLVDQGAADGFLETQLKPELLRRACADAGIDLTLRLQDGYDHSYHFIATFIEDHVAWHAQRLRA